MLRLSAITTGGVAAVSGAQAFSLHARYQALPDARGPREGVAVPSTIANAVAEWSTPPLAREAREFFEREVRAAPCVNVSCLLLIFFFLLCEMNEPTGAEQSMKCPPFFFLFSLFNKTPHTNVTSLPMSCLRGFSLARTLRVLSSIHQRARS